MFLCKLDFQNNVEDIPVLKLRDDESSVASKAQVPLNGALRYYEIFVNNSLTVEFKF